MRAVYFVFVHLFTSVALVCLCAPLWLVAFLLQAAGQALEKFCDYFGSTLEDIQKDLDV
jgi:hypothetical protein